MKGRVTPIVIAVCMIVSCIPTSAFAGASTPRITEGIDASDPVTLISSIQDKEKREMI